MAFSGREPRGFNEEQSQCLRENNQSLSLEFASAFDFFGLKYLHVAPAKTFPGMIIAADGTDFNPGTGVGIYQRNEANTAWRLVG